MARQALIVILAWSCCAFAVPTAFAATGQASLAEALQALARRGHLSILFRPETVSGLRAGKPGKPSKPEAALDEMLRGTGLRARRIAPRTFVIERIEVAKSEGGTDASAPPAERHVQTAAPSSIIVTALRRPTLLLDTPVSMIAIEGQQWSELAGRTNADVARLAPSLAITSQGAGLDRLSLRGVISAGEPSVGLYYGNAPVLGPSGSTSDPGLMTPNLLLIDVDRIEVLRGPQGTLYGAGSLAGTMRVLFRQPELDRYSANLDGSVSSTRGGGNGFDASSVINLALLPGRAALRAVAYRRREAGFVDNVALGLANIGNRDDAGARLAVKWEPDPDWSLSLEGAYQKTDYDDFGSGSGDVGTNRTNRTVRLPFSSRFWMASAVVRGALGTTDVELSASRYRWLPRRSFDFTAVLEDLRGDAQACAGYFDRPAASGCSAAELTQFGSYLDTATPAVLDQPLRVTSTSAELRLSGRGALNWTAGFFVNRRTDRGESLTRSADEQGVVDAAAPLLSLRRFAGSLNQVAAFGDVTWNATDRLHVTAGGRIFRYRRSASGESILRNPATEVYGSEGSESYVYSVRGTAGRMRFDFHPAPDWLIYGEVAQGFRPGGINIVPGLPRDAAVYRGDRLVSRELGWRVSLGRDAIQLSGAAFRQTWSDMEVSAITNNGAFAIISNLGSARIDGIELGLDARVGEHLEANVQATYLDPRLTSDQVSEIAQTSGRAGDRLAFVPPFIVSSVLTSRWDLGGDLAFKLALSGHFSSRHYSTANRTDERVMRIGSAGSIDLRASLQGSVHSVILGVTNLTGSHGRIQASDFIFAPRTITRVRPRTVSIGFNAIF
ncbi:TonB-dependent receptor domain-containing protein [Novosphingobium pentaromativorans]|uniref:TonB-dependent receptor n=1 Tax=Novosphingobium pentaromativorans US6-1 TaxID=1088721 RepID=G6EG12_9SPHN|nr:TonB-dependent receptor [Novosphingobium pentaromativorans]AIT82290.1 TonB-dependent receptor [Novosphingobium pentaromativorans US6-1]EHJ59701.1 TonB-dependent receptor [Novosphingobium pentaromativorans US6-1]